MNGQFERNKAAFRRTCLDFIEAELGMARTFCRISRETGDPERRTRNIQNANIAFQAALFAFRDFNQPNADWKRTKDTLDSVERELACCNQYAALRHKPAEKAGSRK